MLTSPTSPSVKDLRRLFTGLLSKNGPDTSIRVSFDRHPEDSSLWVATQEWDSESGYWRQVA